MRNKSVVLLILIAVAFGAASGQSAKEIRLKNQPLTTTGEFAPDFSLPDENGKSVTLADSKKPTLLIFFRGFW